jgi:hypothetical protein
MAGLSEQMNAELAFQKISTIFLLFGKPLNMESVVLKKLTKLAPTWAKRNFVSLAC